MVRDAISIAVSVFILTTRRQIMDPNLFDLKVIFEALPAGIPLMFVVFCGVAFLRKVGVTDNWLTFGALAWGLVFGAGYQLSLNIPTTFAGWFALIVFGLAVGFLASLFYDEVKRIVEKYAQKQ